MSRFVGKNILLAMTKNDISLFSWTDNDDLSNVSVPNFVIPLHDAGAIAAAVPDHRLFTPGLCLSGQSIVFVRQELPEAQRPTDAQIVFADANTGKILKSISVKHKIRKLLGCGDRFALILTPYVDDEFKNLLVVDVASAEVVGGCVVPHSKTSSPDVPTVDVCDINWLNGISDCCVADAAPVVTLCSNASTLTVVRFNLCWNK